MNRPTNQPRDVPLLLSPAEVKQLSDALWKARCDIWQTARVSEYNLTGKDPLFPADKPNPIPNPPRLITRKGLDDSYVTCEEVCAALKMLADKALPRSQLLGVAADPQ